MNPIKKIHLYPEKIPEPYREIVYQHSTDDKIKPHESAETLEKKARKRRTLTETDKRDFICGCGKSYVSYPAIYLHVQRKHGGEWPENTNLPQKPDTQDKVKRGRPKKEKGSSIEINTDDLEENPNSKAEDNFWTFLGLKGTTISAKGENKFIKPLETALTDPLNCLVLKEIFIDDRFHKQIRSLMELIKKGDRNVTEPSLLIIDNIDCTKYDRNLAHMLIWIGESLREEAFTEFAVIFLLIRMLILSCIWYDYHKSNVAMMENYLIARIRDKTIELPILPTELSYIKSNIEAHMPPFLGVKWELAKLKYEDNLMTGMLNDLNQIMPKKELENCFYLKLKGFTTSKSAPLNKLVELILSLKCELQEKYKQKNFHFLTNNSALDLKELIEKFLEWYCVYDEAEYAIPEIDLNIIS